MHARKCQWGVSTYCAHCAAVVVVPTMLLVWGLAAGQTSPLQSAKEIPLEVVSPSKCCSRWLSQLLILARHFCRTHIKWFIFKHLIAGAMKIGWLKFKVTTILHCSTLNQLSILVLEEIPEIPTVTRVWSEFHHLCFVHRTFQVNVNDLSLAFACKSYKYIPWKRA